MSSAGRLPEARQRYAAASAMGPRSKLPEITYGHKICVAYSTVPINNNLGEFVFLINSFFWCRSAVGFHALPFFYDYVIREQTGNRKSGEATSASLRSLLIPRL